MIKDLKQVALNHLVWNDDKEFIYQLWKKYSPQRYQLLTDWCNTNVFRFFKMSRLWHQYVILDRICNEMFDYLFMETKPVGLSLESRAVQKLCGSKVSRKPRSVQTEQP
jgi:hypothetical protein